MTYNPKLISFFKKHNIYNKQMFDYFSNHSQMIDYDMEEWRPFVGCWPNINKDNYIIGLQVNTPYVSDDKTMLISIHELVHAVEVYQNIGSKYKKEITEETLPLLYEKIYILENPSDELFKYGKYLDSIIVKNKEEAYVFGLKVRTKLLKKYNYNMQEMQEEAKRLARKK